MNNPHIPSHFDKHLLTYNKCKRVEIIDQFEYIFLQMINIVKRNKMITLTNSTAWAATIFITTYSVADE